MPTFHEHKLRNDSPTLFYMNGFSSAHTKFTRSMCFGCVCRVYAEWKNRFVLNFIDALADSLGPLMKNNCIEEFTIGVAILC